jgi:hypothetical protein
VLADEPEVLLADKPTGNLDLKTGDEILALLYSLWEETGITVVLMTTTRRPREPLPGFCGWPQLPQGGVPPRWGPATAWRSATERRGGWRSGLEAR